MEFESIHSNSARPLWEIAWHLSAEPYVHRSFLVEKFLDDNY